MKLTLALTLVFSLVVTRPSVMGQESALARVGDVMAPSRSLLPAIREVLANHGGKITKPAELVFLLDPTPGLVKAEFAAKLRGALGELGEERRKIRVGLGVLGEAGRLALKPTMLYDKLTPKLTRIMARAGERVFNVYSEIRIVVKRWGKSSKTRHLILVSPENGYLEDDLEATVTLLKDYGVSFSAITGEAFLADTYYDSRKFPEHPGCVGRGGDGPFVDLPSRWLLQALEVNQTIPSGLAIFGLTRLATATAGRIFLHGSATAREHRCTHQGRCPFCRNDHLPRGRAIIPPVVNGFSPLATSRERAIQVFKADPLGRIYLQMWAESYQAGLVDRPAPFTVDKLYGNTQEEETPRLVLEIKARGLEQQVTIARKQAKRAELLHPRLLAAYTEHGKKADPRLRAMAALTLLNLHLVRLNLEAFILWAETEAKLQLDLEYAPEPPEMREIPRDKLGALVIAVDPLTLCHGPEALKQLHLPGGVEFQKRLTAFGRDFRHFTRDFKGTPYAAAAWQMSVASFRFSWSSRVASGRNRRPPRATKTGAASTPKHGGRSRPGSRVAPGPTTGGGR